MNKDDIDYLVEATRLAFSASHDGPRIGDMIERIATALERIADAATLNALVEWDAHENTSTETHQALTRLLDRCPKVK